MNRQTSTGTIMMCPKYTYHGYLEWDTTNARFLQLSFIQGNDNVDLGKQTWLSLLAFSSFIQVDESVDFLGQKLNS